MWTRHAIRPLRIQMFHGVGGKYGFDAPAESMRAWDRLFFVNRRRLENFVKAGAIDADSAAIRLIGMPKVDCLVDGSLQRDAVLRSLGLDPARPAILYAPTWSPASSLNKFGVDLVRRLRQLDVSLIVKLHDRSRDLRPQYSGGVNWPERLAAHLEPGRVVIADLPDICRYLAASDAMITDHSSSGFEYLLLDRPLIRIHVPELIALANIHSDYVSLLASAAESVQEVEHVIAAVERALDEPAEKAASRRAVAAELFYQPGTATNRCVAALYEAIQLDPVAAMSSLPSAQPSFPANS
jgi:CDP-glycerol glycerophosphotransferase (TagB/SpsB family)